MVILIQLNLFESNPQLYGLVWKPRCYWDSQLKDFLSPFDVKNPLLFASFKEAEKARKSLKTIIKDRKHKRKGLFGIDQVKVEAISMIDLERMAMSIKLKAS